MKEHADKKALLDSLKDVLKIEKDGSAIDILNDKQLRSELIDEIIWNAAFSPSEEVRGLACFIVRLIGKKTGNGPASIFDIYKARGEGNIKGFTVPAINVRGLSYDFARA